MGLRNSRENMTVLYSILFQIKDLDPNFAYM